MKLEHGSPNILESIDASPFYFGNVGKGQTIQALYTNLFRAPIFKHSPPENTYLLIRHTSLRSTKYYIREIAHTYCVGQLFLTMQVPRPTSRKSINSILKSRLQVSAFRLMRQDPLQRLKLETLVKLFPDFSEQHIRQKVRDFCVYSMGCWKLKPGMSLPTEEELRKLLGPEIGCLYESMLVGEQRLKDVGLNVQDDHDEEESGRLELQTAPWTLTKNFILASQNKSMIQLHGAGDPTSIGEGFSMIKTSMKDVFLRAGETMEDRNCKFLLLFSLFSITICFIVFGGDSKIKSSRVSLAEQQQVYKEEIDRIWNNQLRSLSDKEQRIWPELTGQELVILEFYFTLFI